MNTNDGGTAFPNELSSAMGGGYRIKGGMALRDYFAAKAMQAVIAKNPPCGEPHPADQCDKYAMYSALAYHYADAMLAARGDA